MELTDNELSTLRFLTGPKKVFAKTFAARVFESKVNANTQKLIQAGLIAYSPKRWSGYKATSIGKDILEIKSV